MRANGHAIVWGTHVHGARTKEGLGFLRHLRALLTSRTPRAQQAASAIARTRWDPQREELRTIHAESALEVALSQRTLPRTAMLYGMAL
jgi:hypothetical protein